MSDHYYSQNPVSEIKERNFTAEFNGKTLHLTSVSGVFSFDEKVDKASGLLIRNFFPSGNSILDMGCGYGAIGLFLKALFPQLQVTMADINQRALDYASTNASQNALKVNIVHSDLFSSLEGQFFNDIVTNPPIAAGKKINTDLIHDAWEHLIPGGSLWLVAYHNKGGSTLKDIMISRFGNAEDVEKGGGIRVYRSIRP